jgi:hypothetical protein
MGLINANSSVFIFFGLGIFKLLIVLLLCKS